MTGPRGRGRYQSLYQQADAQTGDGHSPDQQVLIPETDDELDALIARCKNCDPVAVRYIFLIRKLGNNSFESDFERDRVRRVKREWAEITKNAHRAPPV